MARVWYIVDMFVRKYIKNVHCHRSRLRIRGLQCNAESDAVRMKSWLDMASSSSRNDGNVSTSIIGPECDRCQLISCEKGDEANE